MSNMNGSNTQTERSAQYVYADPSTTATLDGADGQITYTTGGTNIGSVWHQGFDTTLKTKRNPVSFVDDDGKMDLNDNNIHIQPTKNGFILTKYSKEEGVEIYTFRDFKEVVEFLDENPIMDLDSNLVADNV